MNVGRMALGLPAFVSATPLGILTLLRHYSIPTAGKKCVVMGRSNIVGKPTAQLMLQKEGADCTVTCVHSRTADLAAECRTADILIVALGSPGFVTPDMVKPGATVIDVLGLPRGGRCRLRRRGAHCRRHHPGARRSGSHDRVLTPAEHPRRRAPHVLPLNPVAPMHETIPPWSLLLPRTTPPGGHDFPLHQERCHRCFGVFLPANLAFSHFPRNTRTKSFFENDVARECFLKTPQLSAESSPLPNPHSPLFPLPSLTRG